jgi:hypothetical protein
MEKKDGVERDRGKISYYSSEIPSSIFSETKHREKEIEIHVINFRYHDHDLA